MRLVIDESADITGLNNLEIGKEKEIERERGGIKKRRIIIIKKKMKPDIRHF